MTAGIETKLSEARLMPTTIVSNQFHGSRTNGQKKFAAKFNVNSRTNEAVKKISNELNVDAESDGPGELIGPWNSDCKTFAKKQQNISTATAD